MNNIYFITVSFIIILRIKVMNTNTSNSCYYGLLSGLITAAALQPLDNIKMAIMIPPSRLENRLSSNFANNLFYAIKFLHLQDGLFAFYRGVIVNVWKTGLGSAIYFYGLRQIENVQNQHSSIGAFFASATSRVMASLFTNPLSVAETRYQMSGIDRWQGSILINFNRLVKNEGAGSLFKGSNASCLKEAGFAGFYYALYSKGKQFGMNSLVSGMCAGLIATLSTHPLQIIRTRTQASKTKLSARTFQVKQETSIPVQLLKLLKQGKIFDGVAPRLIKKPAANTIGFLLFQYFEQSFNSISE